MTIRAVIFDVYGTLLTGEPPPAADIPMRWHRLFQDTFKAVPQLSFGEFSAACAQVIARHHAESRARGIAWPEVVWPAVVAEVLPELARLPASVQKDFLWRQRRLEFCAQVEPEAAATLKALRQAPVLLGIASNAQPYTLRELLESLSLHGLDLNIFEPNLCFFSSEHGFSKPDPHVFQILSARLAKRHISAPEILMIGDRLDHDIEPAKAFGWQTWHLAPTHAQSWPALREFLLPASSS